MSSVRDWYENPANFGQTNAESKAFDWSLFPGGPCEPVLEIGAGLDSQHWHYRPWVTLDFARTPLTLSRTDGVYQVQADARHLPFPDEMFGLVLDLSTGDHIEVGRQKMREEVFRVLKRRGHYVVTYPNARFVNPSGSFGYEHTFDPMEIELELRSAGFGINQHVADQPRSGVRAYK